ncbi:hypothetical protein WR25_14168 [Diploscapter pachys]|uniref:Ubiquitin-like domain-containing protein n=1 Tax=Diploscapter pachys TaxID=2018661 RepID=A0A2A2LKD7_9BILA|nr:hypothetical protein WR25_14168 [Diploscapter pachys]
MFWLLTELGFNDEAIVAVFVAIFFVLIGAAWWVTMRPPMAYDIYIVEMHNWAHRRVVQVIQVGHSFNPTNGWDTLMRRIRSRVTALHAAREAQQQSQTEQEEGNGNAEQNEGNGQNAAANSNGNSHSSQSSNVNVVVRSPMTVINESTGTFEVRESEPLSVLEIEMPVADEGPVTDANRDSHYATAAAIAILSSSNLHYMRSQSVTDSGRIVDESELTGTGQGEQRRNDRTEPISLTSIVNVNVVEMNQTRGRISTEDANDPNDISRSTRDTPPNSLATSADNSDSESEERQFRRRHPRIPRAERLLNQSAPPSRPLTTTTPVGDQPSTSSLVNEDVLYERLSEVSADAGQAAEEGNDDATPTEEGPRGQKGERICVRLKFLDDTQRDVSAHTSDSLEKFKKKHFPEDVASGKVIRLIYQGQLLRDESRSLESYGVKEMSVIHVHISNVPYKVENSVRHRNMQVNGDSAQQISSTRGMQPQQQGDFDPANSSFYVIWAAIFHSLSPFFFRGIFRGLPRTLPFRAGRYITGAYHRLYNAIFNAYNPYGEGNDSLDAAAEAAARPLPVEFNMSDYMIYILSAHILAVWSFVLLFPNYCDRTAFFLLSILTAYFVFIIIQNFAAQRQRNTVRN